MRHADGICRETPVPRIGLGVLRERTLPTVTICEPMICLVVQGAKQVLVGDSILRYDTASCFAASIELPTTGCVVEAEPDRPYVAVSLTLDRDALTRLLADVAPIRSTEAAAGFGVAPVTRPLLEAWSQLIALLDMPDDVPYLAEAREREVLYRLLQGAHGPMLRQIVREDSRLSQIRRAIAWIRQNFDQTLRTEMLADIAGMSIPAFHRHFKAATASSPLQYQKMLRLQAARRLLAANADAARAAYAVGYESASQFSREYARLFGVPPIRDALRLRTSIGDAEGVF
ncbi:AraC family transcriptional regulator N-terminal domain-containing protein [Rhizobium sp. YIM 134829]|uniref:AraC family transcriptional regulator n=1 Tax=Rhizobium sp. YIM 134829 TaxID=3390453 RepID=UPI00397B7E62